MPEVALVSVFLLGLVLFILLIHLDVTSEENEKDLLQKQSNTSVKSIKGRSLDNSSFFTVEIEEKRLPQAIIIGSRKCGTRALLKFLELNPAVRAARKEVHFFDKPQNYKLGLNWYKNQMPESTKDQITIEKSPAYFVTKGVAERVHAMNYSVKLVLIFRNPVTRLISDYSQLVANKLALIEDDEDASSDYLAGLEEAINNDDLNNSSATNISYTRVASTWTKSEEDFEKYVLRQDGGINDQHRAVRIGMYSIYLEKWRTLFPSGQFHFVDGENLIQNPHEEMNKLELFLNLKPKISSSDFVFNKRKGFYCISLSNQNLSSTPISCLSRSKGRRHINVRRDIIDELEKFYAPYNEYLYSLIGRNLNWSSVAN